MFLFARCLTVLLALWLMAGGLHAWADSGHRLIGELAESRLDAETARKVWALLDGQTLAKVSTWADELIDTERCSHTEPWHYINIADGQTLESSERSPRGDLVAAIERFERQLRRPDATREEKAWALQYLVHLIGDLHQPLHVGRREDRGGNDLVVDWFGETTNLHLVWDFFLIDRAGLEVDDLNAFLESQDPSVLARWRAQPVLAWLQESLEHRQAAYADEFPARFGEPYLNTHRQLIRQRLAQAGIRLADLLNAIFSNPEFSARKEESIDRATEISAVSDPAPVPCGPERPAEK